MKLSFLLLLLGASCGGDSFENAPAITKSDAGDVAAEASAPADVAAEGYDGPPDSPAPWRPDAPRDVLADPWPDSVEVVDAPACPPARGCCPAPTWGDCGGGVSGCGCAECATWNHAPSCYAGPVPTSDGAPACENCYWNGSRAGLLCCTHGQGPGSDCPAPFENKGPVVHCSDCPCQ